MRTSTCNCSILGGTTDSRPCPIHDAPTTRRTAAHVIACDVCNDSGYIPHDGGTLPCPYCNPKGAREASAIYDPVEATS